MKIEEYKKLSKNPPKYRNRKVVTKNGSYDSQKEADRHEELLLMEKVGAIQNLKRQVKFTLIPTQYDQHGMLCEHGIKYIADFTYSRDGRLVVEDTKGFKTPEYIIKRKLMLYIKKIRILET